MADRSIANSIANTFHLDGNNIFTRDRYRRRAIALSAVRDELIAWSAQCKKDGPSSFFSQESWASIIKGLGVDVEKLNKLAQEGDK